MGLGFRGQVETKCHATWKSGKWESRREVSGLIPHYGKYQPLILLKELLKDLWGLLGH